MKIALLRRRGLGLTSCKAIINNSKHKIDLIRSDKIPPTKYDLLVRWGTRASVDSKRVLNKAGRIADINNKLLTRIRLQENDLSVPKTWLNPNSVDRFPVIVRPQRHSQGKKLYLCRNRVELMIRCSKMSNFYISEYIDKDKEFGVFIFNNRVWSVIEKTPKTEEGRSSIAWNVAAGTHSFENNRWSDWNPEMCIEALKAAKQMNIDFTRVDVIQKGDKFYILELNSAHSLTSEYRQKTFTRCLDWYIENGPVENEIDFEKVGTYKSFIHPALRKNNKKINL